MKTKEEKPKDLIFNLYDYLSYNTNLQFFFGGRSIGKTFAFKYLAINEFIKKGSKSIYLKRYKDDLGDKATFFSKQALLDMFPDYEFKVEGDRGYLRLKDTKEWELFIRFKALSQGQNLKGSEYENVDYICFDEVIIENTQLHHYLRNEYNLLNSVMSTIDRSRDKLKVFCLSNAGLIDNPYFSEFDITFRELSEKGYCTLKRAKINQFTNKRHYVYLHFLNNNDYLYGRLAKESSIAGVASNDYFSLAFENFFGGGNSNLVVDANKIKRKILKNYIYLDGKHYELYAFEKGMIFKHTNKIIKHIAYTTNVLDSDNLYVLYSKSLRDVVNKCFYANSLYFGSVEDSIVYFDNFKP